MLSWLFETARVGNLSVLGDLLLALGSLDDPHEGRVLVDAVWSGAADSELAADCGMDIDALIPIHAMREVLADLIGMGIETLLVLTYGVLFALDF